MSYGEGWMGGLCSIFGWMSAMARKWNCMCLWDVGMVKKKYSALRQNVSIPTLPTKNLHPVYI